MLLWGRYLGTLTCLSSGDSQAIRRPKSKKGGKSQVPSSRGPLTQCFCLEYHKSKIRVSVGLGSYLETRKESASKLVEVVNRFTSLRVEEWDPCLILTIGQRFLSPSGGYGPLPASLCQHSQSFSCFRSRTLPAISQSTFFLWKGLSDWVVTPGLLSPKSIRCPLPKYLTFCVFRSCSYQEFAGNCWDSFIRMFLEEKMERSLTFLLDNARNCYRQEISLRLG